MAFIIPSHFSNLPYLNTEHTSHWLKFWLKSISFGSNFFPLAKMLATTSSQPGLALAKMLATTNSQPGLALDQIYYISITKQSRP